jgi:hypothetical protein
MTDTDLSRMQLDILHLESQTWSKAGEKISAFKRLYPHVTEIGYLMALLVLIDTPAAYEFDGQRYAAMLRRLDETQKAEFARRVGLRSVPERL